MTIFNSYFDITRGIRGCIPWKWNGLKCKMLYFQIHQAWFWPLISPLYHHVWNDSPIGITINITIRQWQRVLSACNYIYIYYCYTYALVDLQPFMVYIYDIYSVYIYIYIHSYIYIYIHAYIYIFIYIYIQLYTYIYIYIYMPWYY